jgi:hypothetical protein
VPRGPEFLQGTPPRCAQFRTAGTRWCGQEHRPLLKPAERHPAALTLSEQALVTVLRQRFSVPQRVLAGLFGVATGTIAKAERQARPLLARYGIQIEPATAAIKTLEDLTAYGAAHGIDLTPKIKPAR